MKKRINKKTLILLSLLLLLPLFSGCFLFPSTNQSPTITSTPSTTATVDELYTYDVEATDPDGDTLTYSLTTPTGMTIDSVTGVISWTPTFDQIGDNDVTVEVSDGLLSDSQNFIIIVSEAEGPGYTPPSNRAPTITSTPITIVTVDELYTYDVNATDPDGDTLTYSLTTNPTGMTIDPATGVISWTPNSGQIGDNNVTVEVSDGKKSTTQSFTVKVYDILTSITVLPETMTLFVGEDDTITAITASYNYGPDKIIALNDPDCSYSWNTGGIASVTDGVVTGVAEGLDTLTVSYTEGTITETDTVEVTVNPIELTSITVLPETMTLFVGEDDSIDLITASYNYGPDKIIALNDPDCSYSWNTGGIASVTDGVVTGVAEGLDTLTVSYTEGTITETDTVAVTVNPELTSIVVLPETMTLFVGEADTIDSITASYNYGPDASIALADCSYSWNTGGIASVTDGVVTGVAEGLDTLTVSYTEGTITKTDTVEVTVNPILPNLELTPASQPVAVGNQATIDVVVENVTDLRGANITLNFDASKLQYVSFADGGFIPSAFLPPETVDNVNGSIILDIAGMGEFAYASGTGTIITVVFDAIATASPTNITFGSTILRDKGNFPITHTKGSGCSVTIN